MNRFSHGMRWGMLAGTVVGFVIMFVVLVARPALASNSACAAAVTHDRWCLIASPVGHRANHGPNEDTLAALAVADKQNGWWENDVWLTRDHVPVVMHDVDLHRTVDPASMPPGVTPSSRPQDLTLEQWKQLRTYGGRPLPTLYRWLTYAGRHHVPGMIEIKYRLPDPAMVVGWTRKWPDNRVLFYQTPHYVNGFCHEESANDLMREGATVGLKQNRLCPQSLLEAADNNYSFVITAASELTNAYVREAHSLGLETGCYLSNATQWPALVQARTDYILAPHLGPLTAWLGQ